jgi:Ca2+-dependent lipid-binding protein
MDTFSKSDPRVIVHQKINGKWRKMGQTEIIDNNLNPVFNTSVQMNYSFEILQEVKFEVIDDDGGDGKDYDLIGSAESTMGNIMGSAG